MIAKDLVWFGVTLIVLVPGLAFAVYYFGERSMRKHHHS